MSNLSSVCLRNQRIILSKAFTIKYYAPPLASNVLQHHQWPRITTADNNNSRRILILISLYCSSMLATISQLPEEQMATKRKCFVVKHLLFIWFFIVSCNGRGDTPPLTAAVASLGGGDYESKVKWVSAKSRQPPPSLPQHTLYADYARVLPISNLEPVFNEISKGKKRQKYNVTKKARLQDRLLFLNYLRLIFNSWREE